jgi:antitoxin HicB
VAKRNPRTGSSFDEFLKQEGVYEEVVAKALKRALAEQLEEGMQSAKLTKVAMARRMSTSRSQLERVLDPQNVSVQLDTLIKAARAVGKTVEIRFKKLAA